ncbi:MAG: transporter substrate-binding domain-containing protein [Cyanobacteria bacterium P01_D01_bin.36]
MLRNLLAGLIVCVGAQLLLPPIFIDQFTKQPGDQRALQFFAPAAAAELSEIQARGYLIVGVKTNRLPLGFIDETGEISGFEIDIARRLAETLLGDATAVEFVPLRNVDRLNAVLEGRVDIAIAAITLTEPRRRLVDFSDPYYLDGTAFVVGDTVQTLQDLRTRRIALLNRSSTVAHVRYLLPGAELIGVDTYSEGQALLQNGSVDAYAGDASVLTGWVNTQGPLTGYSLLPNIISAEPLAIAIPKGGQHDELQAAINRSIRRGYAEEWLQERARFWELPSGVLPSLLAPADAESTTETSE